jgi:hypothetical protein
MNSIQLIISNEVREIQIKEYMGQRVVTLKDVDDLHTRQGGTARKTFNSHKSQFVDKEDYFVLNTDEAYKLFGLRAPKGLTVLTESGYLLIVKPFTDDLAWVVQKQLVNAYFKVKQAYQEQVVPTSTEDIMIYTLQSQKEMKLRIENLENENRKLSLIVDNSIYLDDHQKSEIQEAVFNRVGKLVKLGYETHFQSIFRTLKSHFSVPKYDKILKKDFEIAIDLINGWYPKKNENQA